MNEWVKAIIEQEKEKYSKDLMVRPDHKRRKKVKNRTNQLFFK